MVTTEESNNEAKTISAWQTFVEAISNDIIAIVLAIAFGITLCCVSLKTYDVTLIFSLISTLFGFYFGKKSAQ